MLGGIALDFAFGFHIFGQIACTDLWAEIKRIFLDVGNRFAYEETDNRRQRKHRAGR